MIGHKDCRCPGCGRCDAAERDAARRSASPALAKARNERDAAIAERDRLRRELDALRDEVRTATLHIEARDLATAVVDRIDAILRGES